MGWINSSITGHQSRKGCVTQFILNMMKENDGVFGDAHWEHLARHIVWDPGSKVINNYVHKIVDQVSDSTALFTNMTRKIPMKSDTEIVATWKSNPDILCKFFKITNKNSPHQSLLNLPLKSLITPHNLDKILTTKIFII